MNLKFNLYELEPLILIHCLKDKTFFLKIKNNIKSDYFQNEKLGKIFEVIINYHNKYKTFPELKTLNSLFKRNFIDKAPDYLDVIKFLFNYNEKYDIAFITDNTISFIKQARVIEAIKRSIPMIDEGNYDQIYEGIKDAIIVDFDKDLGIDFTSQAIEKIKEKHDPRISTGYNNLDAIMGGGFENKCIYVYSGNYGIGKSIWLQNIALRQMLNNKNVIYYTLELSDKAVVKRLVSMYTKITQNDFLEKIKDIEKQFKTLMMITESNLWIKEYPTGFATINHIASHLEELKTVKDFNPDIIFVDYCNIMNTTKKVSLDNSYIRTKFMYEELRALAQELNLPVITAAQINRGGMDEKKGGTKQLVTGANISDSLGIGMTADGHFIINQTMEEKESSTMRLFIDKNRQGPDKLSKSFGINYESLTIEEDIQIIS